MKKLLLTIYLLLLPVYVFAQGAVSAKVVGIVDGDTLTVLTKEKRQIMFRLTGIDAPEKEQDFGTDAKQFLSNLVLNQTVSVSEIKKDCLGRMSATVTFKGGDLSSFLVKSGNAWVDTTCANNGGLVKEETAVKEKKVGLWQNLNPIRPSEFRKPEKEVVANVQTRRIFEGLAPTPPPLMTPKGKPSGLYIGMELADFTKICGKGEESTTFKTGQRHSFSIDIPATEENKAKGCSGNFKFEKTVENPIFTLWAVNQ